MLKVFITFSIVFLSFNISIISAEPVSLTINLIGRRISSGAGKEIDFEIVKNELEHLGHRVNLYDYSYMKLSEIEQADINLFFAQFKPKYFAKAKLNWFIPNAEWCNATLNDLKKFDLILCKTKEAVRIFKPLCKKVYYLGFTTLDHYDPAITKDYSKYFHAGSSRQKRSKLIHNVWKQNLSFPQIILISKWLVQNKSLTNVSLITERLETDTFLSIQNQCGVHIYPSTTEGFGHAILEAMSVGAIVITTNGPPMNEFITDERCLVGWTKKGKMKYGTTFFINPENLKNTVKNLENLSLVELETIGQQNRQNYLIRDKEFKVNIKNLMETAVDHLKND